MGIVTLVSGGLDSTLMSLMANEEGIHLHPLFIDYGQLGTSKEWEACVRLHKKFALPEVVKMDISGFGQIVTSGITNSSMKINEDAFLPGRNLLLLLVGSAYAYRIGANSIAIGLLDPENALFPDQTPEFIKKTSDVIETTLGKSISILTPLIKFSKDDILKIANEKGLKETYSCHSGNDIPCGKCIACLEINNARERR